MKTVSPSNHNQPKAKAEQTHDPVHTVRQGAVAASIWLRQSPSGYAYYDYSLSRSWKSMSTNKTGYSKNFFETNQAELVSVIERASAWIAAQREEPVETQNGATPVAA